MSNQAGAGKFTAMLVKHPLIENPVERKRGLTALWRTPGGPDQDRQIVSTRDGVHRGDVGWNAKTDALRSGTTLM